MTKSIHRMLRLLISAVFAFGIMQAEVLVINNGSYIDIKTEYGEHVVTEPVLIELFESAPFKRLQLIRQYGVCCYAREQKDFTRYDHSIGVFVLLRRYGAGLEEQIAGLLHDVSHTVFSHVGDLIFDSYYNNHSYQDDVHEWYLQKTGIADILCKRGYGNACTEATKKKQRMLEQDKPDLCADRIEYLLRGALVDGLIKQAEIEPILQSLCFKNEQWVFKNKEHARTVADISLLLNEYVFSAPWNLFIYYHASQALQQAVQKKILTMDDIHFSTDDVIWQRMWACGDDSVLQSIDKVTHYQKYFSISSSSDYDQYFKAKFFGVDPLVETENGIVRLSMIDSEYAIRYKRVQNLMARGVYIKLIR